MASLLERVAFSGRERLRRLRHKRPEERGSSPRDSKRGALLSVVAEPDRSAADWAARDAFVGDHDWARCPATSALLPEGWRDELDVGFAAWREARRIHRHRWFYALARSSHHSGDPGAGAIATDALGRWLLSDRVEFGIPWLHASDAATRVVYWGLGASLLGDELDPDLWRRMAGSVQDHLAFTRANLSLRSDVADHRLITQAAALVVGGLVWPDVDGARQAWSEGLTVLGRHLPRQVLPDGSPVGGSVALSQRVLSLGLVARAFAKQAGMGLSSEGEDALSRLAWYHRVIGEGGPEPSIGERPYETLLGNWQTPERFSGWNALASNERVPGDCSTEAPDDTTARLLGGRSIAGVALMPKKNWAMVAFRESGHVVMQGKVKGQASRVVVIGGQARSPFAHDDAGSVLWTVKGRELLVDPGAHEQHPALRDAQLHGRAEIDGRWSLSTLHKARVDERICTVVVERQGRGDERHRRDVRVEGARVIVTDQLRIADERSVIVRWPLGPGWEIEPGAKKGWSASQDGMTVQIDLDEKLSWTLEEAPVVGGPGVVQAPVFVGTGRLSTASIRASFEVR